MLSLCADWNSEVDKYFNAGVMLLDLDQLRDAPSLDLSKCYPHLEQDFLNATFRGRWAELPAAWNAQGLGSYCKEAIQEPLIVHFTGATAVSPRMLLDKFVVHPAKPSAYLSVHPYREEFFGRLDETPWKSWRPVQRQAAEATLAELRKFVQAAEMRDPAFISQTFWNDLLHILRSAC
jgi:lipopolysaccharide biosynthesis glycosyltransferase